MRANDGCLPVDKDLHPICDSITWDDRRSSRQVMQIERQLGNETIHKITGTCIGDSFSLPKVLWIKQNRPDIYEKAYKFITCKDYVCYMLTGILCTDETCAGFTQMYDLYSGCWSKSILTAFDIDEEKLPDVLRAGSIIGTLTERAASQTGLSINTPVVMPISI